MHANSGMIPFHHVLQLVARLDSQCPANLPRNGRLSLARYLRLQHRRSLHYSVFLTSCLSLTFCRLASGLRDCFRVHHLGATHCLDAYLRGSFRLVLATSRLMAATAVKYTAQYFLASSTSELWITPPTSTRTAG